MLGVHEWRVILLVLVVTSAGEDGDPCDPANHDVMNDPWRSSSHKEPAGSKRCDATLSEKWYRPLGVNMVTSPPDLNRCGTSFPIYLNKTIPNSTDITEVTVCMRTMFSKCHDSWKIRVKNCKGYYVYELKQTRLCDAAYCFGDKLKCPAGQNSETGYQPDCGVPPDVKLIAQITVELNETTTEVKETPTILKGIVFQCDISSDEDLTGYVYDIQWFINDNSIVTHRNIPYTNLTQTGLHQSEWTGTYRMSFLVKCAVRARNNTSVPTPYQSSDEFYAGYITDSSEYEVFENSATTMTISLTVPIDCLYPVSYTPEEIKIHLKNECYITIRVLAPTYYDINGDIKCTYGGVTDEPVSFDNGDCGVKFKFNEWSTPKNFTIYGSADNVVNTYVRMTRIRFKVDDSVVSLAWPFSTKPDNEVYVKDKDKDLQDKTCCLQTDPHLNTFDGVADRLKEYGEFIVYAHTALPILIIGKFEKCWQARRGTCTCAIAIRYMDDVFVLNFCKKTTHFADLRACGDPLITIKYGKSTYEVMLPTGLEIYIGLHQGKLDTHINMVILKPSLADWGATIGLCGVLDGDKETDLQPRSEKASMGFEESWKVDTNLDGPSLLNSSLPLGDIPLPPLQFCKCPDRNDRTPSINTEVHCNIASTITACQKRTDHTANTPFIQQCDTGRVKRDIHVHSDRFTRSADADIEEPKFEFNMESNTTWINGWNESLAEEACRNTMNNDPMLIKCKDAVAGMNRVTAGGIHECMSDIMLSGHTGYMDGTLTALHQNCLVEAVRLENLTTQGPNGTTKTFFNELQELSCPKNCSGNGNCINGTCECIDGFHGDSCTLTSDTPPGIPVTGTTCPLDQNTCRNFVITGGVFLDVNLTCQVRLLKIFINRWDSHGSPVIFPARYMTDFTCICAIPDSFQTWRMAVSEEIFAEGYFLSISNDGTHFSNETTILAYDSTCYDCDPNTWNCSKLLESCDPTTDAVVITEAPIPNDSDFPPGAISGIVIGIVFFLGITTTIFIIYRSLSNNSKVHPERESKWLQLTSFTHREHSMDSL